MSSALNAGEVLAPYEVTAVNYAVTSENRMHADDTAADYGFRGGLVPGVALYAYMTVPVMRTLGRAFLEGGAMTAKFLKPVYDGERIRVEARVVSSEPLRIDLNLFNPEKVLCAVGEARIEHAGVIDASRYSQAPLPPRDERRAARCSALPPGTVLGSLEFTEVFPEARGETGKLFLDEVLDPIALYRGEHAVWHPAWLPAKANRILMENVALGPWIHTASEVHYVAAPADREHLRLLASVAESFEKRGHEMVRLDCVLFGREDRVIAWTGHTAIVRPAKVAARS